MRDHTARAVIVASMMSISSSAYALDPATVLSKLDFPADSEQQVAAGKFVETALPTRSERDLNVGIAFMIEEPPADVARRARDEMVIERADPDTIAFGALEGEGSAEQFATLKLTDAQVKAYASAKAGDALNLSGPEIAALQATGGDRNAIEAKVRELLLARYRAYRAKGLAGMAPYDRGGSSTDPAADMDQVGEAARKSGVLPPAFYDLLHSYPQGKPRDFSEHFYWTHFRANGAETVALVHAFQATFDGTLVTVQRHFYASGGYNMVQAVAGLLPIPKGTLVIYGNHTSTDQVAGFGSSAKRSIGRKIMAGQLEKIFTDSRKMLTK